jgi:ectoine hydroxylase-related dioxygenase (phytanoyl-CoA dioxygenase family)
MITRQRVYLELLDSPVPEASTQLEHDGYAVMHQALDAREVAELADAVADVYDQCPADIRQQRLSHDERDEFRYEMLNRSAACQAMVGDRRILDVIEPLLGEDCHVIANTAWWNEPAGERRQGGSNWHIDAGPHVPRPAGVPWDDRIPYPVFAIGVHVLLRDCDLESGPTVVVPGSHRSGQAPPFEAGDDLSWNGRGGIPLTGAAGDIVLFVSDVWHRRGPSGPRDQGRFFLQVHYGRRDLAQRIRPTRTVNHLSPEAIERAAQADHRARTIVGLHPRGFYDG